MKLHLIYFQMETSLANEKYRDVLACVRTKSENGITHGLYAATFHKSAWKDFYTYRKDAFDKGVFVHKVREVSSGEAEEIYDTFELNMLAYIPFEKDSGRCLSDEKYYSKKNVPVEYFNDDTVCIPITGHELNYLEMDWWEYLADWVRKAPLDYNIFKEEEIDALDKLGYTYLFDVMAPISDDDDPFLLDRAEVAEDNATFGISPCGNALHSIPDNLLLGFLEVYKYFIYG